jgi:phage terminase large subunit-like protein
MAAVLAASEFSRDYVGIARAYAEEAADLKNRKRFNKEVRQAAQRFLRDLWRAEHPESFSSPSRVFYFDPWCACDPCDFIEKLPHVEGTWDTPNLTLHRSDVWFVVNLFGFRKATDHSRRFSKAIKAIARKNAKTTVAAGIGLYCQTCDGEVGPQVVSAAPTGAQARIVFDMASKMVNATPDLQEQFSLQVFKASIASYDNGGSFKPLTSKAKTKDGLNPSCVVIDEVHAHQDHDLINVLTSAAGARRNVLFLYVTTEGFDSPGPWAELRDVMKKILDGVLDEEDSDHILCVFYKLDDEDKEAKIPADDDFDEAAWIKANPLIEVNDILFQKIREEAAEAKHMPGKLAEFRIKRLNRPSAVSGGWIDIPRWRKCAGAVDLQALKDVPCFGGLDLASVRDFCSYRLIWELDGVVITHGWSWVPKLAVAERKRRGLVPYTSWLEAGHLIEAGEEVVDHGSVLEKLIWVRENFRLVGNAYDSWNAAQLAKKARDAGVPMQEFVQGPKSYHPAMQALEVAYFAGNFRHGNAPVLNWCASNIVARQDQNLNKAPDKKKSADKIDEMTALLMAFGASLAPEEETGTIDSWLKAPIV